MIQAHSGVRYLVLMFAVISIVYIAYGLITKKPYDKTSRIMGIVFTSLLDLNVLLGIVLIFIRGYFSYQLMHIIFMVIAVTTAHVLAIVNKKREQPSYQIALFAIVIPLVLILFGISQLG